MPAIHSLAKLYLSINLSIYPYNDFDRFWHSVKIYRISTITRRKIEYV